MLLAVVGKDPARDKNGRTMKKFTDLFAMDRGKPETLPLLIQVADVNIRDYNGKTSLMSASARFLPDDYCVKLVLQ